MMWIFIFYIILMSEDIYEEEENVVGKALAELIEMLLEIEADQEAKKED